MASLVARIVHPSLKTTCDCLRIIGFVVLLVLVVDIEPQARAAEDPYDGAWHFIVAPYVWLPVIDGTLRFNTPPGASGSPETSTESNILEHLNFALMIAGEARKGNWAVITDFIYLDLGEADGAVNSISGSGSTVIPVNLNTNTGLTGVLWQLGGSYTVAGGQAATLDVLAGFRFMWVDASLNWQIANGMGLLPPTGSFSEDEKLLDGIIGVRGKVNLGGGNWFVPYYVDIGTGSSELTWQGNGGFGYSFGWGDVLLTYRYLFYNQNADKLFQNVSFSGPLIGAAIRF